MERSGTVSTQSLPLFTLVSGSGRESPRRMSGRILEKSGISIDQPTSNPRQGPTPSRLLRNVRASLPNASGKICAVDGSLPPLRFGKIAKDTKRLNSQAPQPACPVSCDRTGCLPCGDMFALAAFVIFGYLVASRSDWFTEAAKSPVARKPCSASIYLLRRHRFCTTRSGAMVLGGHCGVSVGSDCRLGMVVLDWS